MYAPVVPETRHSNAFPHGIPPGKSPNPIPPDCCSAVSGESIDVSLSLSIYLSPWKFASLGTWFGYPPALPGFGIQQSGVPRSHLHFEERPHLLRHVGYAYDDGDDGDDSLNGEWWMANGERWMVNGEWWWQCRTAGSASHDCHLSTSLDAA